MKTTVDVIYWRDIPAQVIAKAGRNVHRVELAGRFQRAIDQAATKAGLTGTDEYLGEWHKERTTVDGDPAEIAAEQAARFETAFSDEVLARYVTNMARQP